MSNGNNNQQFDLEGLKKLVDSLYVDRAVKIEDNMPAKTREEYNRLRAVVNALYSDEKYNELVDILKEYTDKTYAPNTVGEYLFGCIDVNPDDVGCVPICNKSILPSNKQYKPCKWPVYRVNAAGAIELESNGQERDSDTVVVISASGQLPAAAASALRNNGVRLAHVYREYPSRFISTVDISNLNPIPPPVGGDLGKKGADKGKALKKGGKSSWWTIALMILGGIAILSALWYVFGGKKSKNGSSGSNGSSTSTVETVQVPRYNMPRQYPTRTGNLFC